MQEERSRQAEFIVPKDTVDGQNPAPLETDLRNYPRAPSLTLEGECR